MNERIKSLAFQAGFIGESMYSVFGTTQQEALDNFAELIVKECAELVEYNSKGAGRDIREHFGVENE
jgi:hypothetical protein